MVYEDVKRIDSKSASAMTDIYNYYTSRTPVILSNAIGDSMLHADIWDFMSLSQIIINYHRKEQLKGLRRAEITATVRDKRAPTFYRDIILPDMDAYFKHAWMCYQKNIKQSAGLTNGINLPLKELEWYQTKNNQNAFEIPEILKNLHEENKLKLRDLLGRENLRLFVSSKGYHGRCHYDRLGLPFFSGQIRGSKTWYLYEPSEISLNRHESFDNSPPVDFADESVRERYNGFKATLNCGEILFIPPYYYHSVEHIGSYNVNLDYACCPDKIWQQTLQATKVAVEDIIGILGSRAFLCYAVPAGLLPFGDDLMKVRAYLLKNSFEDKEIRLTMAILFRKRVDENMRESYLDEAFALCVAPETTSAVSNGISSQLAEACIACECMFVDTFNIIYALSRLYKHIQDDKEAIESLKDNLRLVRSLVVAITTEKEIKEVYHRLSHIHKTQISQILNEGDNSIKEICTNLFGRYFVDNVLKS